MIADALDRACAEAREGPVGLRRALATLQPLRPASADPPDPAAIIDLLRLLHAIGRRDLPLGRLFEGDTDARQIVCRYGTPAQAARLTPATAVGVWNADAPGDPLVLADGRLSGAKSFASGAGLLTHALVTADAEDGRRVLLLDLGRTPPAIDRDWWRTIGMQRSETHVVRWHEAPIAADDRIGDPGDYVREPWFSGGALRFAAVQAGGIAGLFDRVRDHLAATDRAHDPHQAGRLAALFGAAEAAAAAVRRAADAWFVQGEDALIALVAAARVAVAEAGDRAIMLAGQAVGVQGMFHAHPLSALLADLSVYLRQPAPDAQRMRVGAAAAAGLIGPVL